MRRSVLLAALLALAVLAPPATADMTGYAVKHVFLTVEPDVAVGATSVDTIDAGSIQRGEVEVTIPFRVDANQESLSLYVTASPLFKGDDPSNNDVSPIDLCGWVEIYPTNASPMAGGSNRSTPVGDDFIDAFPALVFESIDFESSQNGHFSQDVDVIVCWNQDEFEKPVGEYSGLVKLTAVLFDFDGSI